MGFRGSSFSEFDEKKKYFKDFLGVIFVILLGISTFADDPLLYEPQGLDPLKLYDSAIGGEEVDLFRGSLHIEQTDVLLPGRHGLDLAITRWYDTKIKIDVAGGSPCGVQSYILEKGEVLGVGWRMHMGRFYQNTSATYPPPANTPNSGDYLELPGGKRISFYRTENGLFPSSLPPPGTAHTPARTGAGYWLAIYPYLASDPLTIYSPDGVKYTFSSNWKRTIDTNLVEWNVTSIEKGDAVITINYTTMPDYNYTFYISTIVDSYGRTITLNYFNDGNAAIVNPLINIVYPIAGSGNNATILYYYINSSSSYPKSVTVTAPKSRFVTPTFGIQTSPTMRNRTDGSSFYALGCVQPPTGTNYRTYYQYYFDNGAGGANAGNLIAGIKYPNGSITGYEYAFQTRGDFPQGGFGCYLVLYRRAIEGDMIAGLSSTTSEIRSWKYTYTVSGSGSTSLWKVSIDTPVGSRENYYFNPFVPLTGVTCSDGDCSENNNYQRWRVGLLLKKEIWTSPSETTKLLQEDYNYEKIPYDSTYYPWLCNQVAGVYQFKEKGFSPILTSKTTVLTVAGGTLTSRVSYSAHDQYGNPGTIEETDWDNSTIRTKLLTYAWSSDSTLQQYWLICLPKYITTKVGTTTIAKSYRQYSTTSPHIGFPIKQREWINTDGTNSNYWQGEDINYTCNNTTKEDQVIQSIGYSSSETTSVSVIRTVTDIVRKGTPLSKTVSGTSNLVVFSRTLDTNGLAPLTETIDGTTNYSYDSYGRLITVSPPSFTNNSGAVSPSDTTVTYFPTQITLTTGSSGPEQIYVFDGFGELARKTQKAGSSTIYDDTKKDAFGRVVTKYLSAFSPSGEGRTEYTYDALGRILTKTLKQSNGTIESTINYTYSKSGNYLRVTITSPKDSISGTVTSYEDFDSQGRLRQQTDANNNIRTFTYDALNRLTSITDGPQTRSYTYNSRGDMLTMNTPESGLLTMNYDRLGNLISRNFADGTTLTYLIDFAGRVKEVSFPDNSKVVNYYDAYPTAASCAATSAFTSKHLVYQRQYDPGNNIIQSTCISYDSHGRVFAKRYAVDAANYDVKYDYNSSGFLSKLYYPSGRTVEAISMNNMGWPASLKDNNNSNFITGLTYSPQGKIITSASATGGTALTNGEDDFGRLISTSLKYGSTVLFSGAITYFPSGNLNSQTMQYQYPSGNLTHNWAYTYDLLHRLTGGAATGSMAGSITYLYDTFGNITSRAASGFPNEAALDFSGITYSNNRKSGSTYTYDGRGNIAFDNGVSYNYNYLNQLTAAQSCSHIYDSQGRRIRETCPAGTGTQSTYYIYDDTGNLLSEFVKFDTAAAKVRRENVYLSGQLVSQWTDDFYCVTQSVSPSNSGTISRTPDRDCFDWGETCLLTATANSGYSFANWTVNGVTMTESPLNLCMDKAKAVVANFLHNKYCITKSSQPADGGTISANPASSDWCYDSFTTISLIATPATGCQFLSWQVGANTYTQNPLSLYMDENKTVIAKFQYCLTQSVAPPGDGTITLSPTGSCYDPGTNVTAAATANYGYIFDHWQLNGVNAGSVNPLTFSMNGSKDLQAVFVTDPYACSPPPQPLELIAEDAHKNELTGNYQILLKWHHLICSNPSVIQYEILFKMPSASSWDIFGPISYGEYIRNQENISYLWNAQRGCEYYQIMVRAKNTVSGLYSQTSNTVVQRSTITYPPAVAWAYVCCNGLPYLGWDNLYWYLSKDDACVVSGFNIRTSPNGPIFAYVPATGGSFYEKRGMQCPNNAKYYISTLAGETEGYQVEATLYCGPILVGPPIPKLKIETSLSQSNVLISDISGDSLFDLVLQSAYFKANPDGTFFDSSTDLNTTAGDGDIIRIADLDGNGSLDRIIASKKQVWVELNDGSGHFTHGPYVNLAKNVNDMALSQIPEYWGISTLVLTDNDLTIFGFSNGSWVEREHIEIDRKGVVLKTGDLNGDWITDIAVGTTDGINLYLYSIESEGWVKEYIPAAGNVATMDVADVNGDGFTDIAVGPMGGGIPLVLLFTPSPNPPASEFPIPHIWSVMRAYIPDNIPGIRQIILVDLDGTGLPGMLVVSEAVDKSVYLTNDGSGKMLQTNFYLSGKVFGAGVGDLDKNGLLDIVTVKNGVVDIYESQFVRNSTERMEDASQDLPPGLVRNVESSIENGKLVIKWLSAEDDRTPSTALTYEVAVGSQNGFWDILPGEVGPGQFSSRKGNVLNATRVNLPLPEGVTEIHYGIQAIDSGFRKGEWVFGTMKVPCESKEEDNSKEKDILKVTNISTMEHTDKIEGLCEDGAMHIARLLEKQGYVTTTWAGGIVSYLPGEPKATESAPMVLSAGKYLYPVFDATGTVRMWADGSGNIIARSAPGPYGEDLGYFPGPRTSMLGFAGYLGDKGGSMLWHTPNRSLTNQGRYLSVDPSGTLNLHDPRTFNQYAYVVGNPVMFIDPSGLNWFPIDENRWEWHEGEEYNGKTSPYTHMLEVTTIEIKRTGTKVYEVTLWEQNKAIMSGTAFSGGVEGYSALPNGNYRIRSNFWKDEKGYLGRNDTSPLNNPPKFEGIQRISKEGDPAVYAAYGPIRAYLQPIDWSGNIDMNASSEAQGNYYHGQDPEKGYTHGCLSYGTDASIANYIWNLRNDKSVCFGVAVNQMVVKP